VGTSSLVLASYGLSTEKEAESEDAANARVAFQREPSPVGLGDAPGHRQAEPAPWGLPCSSPWESDELSEDLGLVLRVDPRPAVLHLDHGEGASAPQPEPHRTGG
jgi:hypothetical protein